MVLDRLIGFGLGLIIAGPLLAAIVLTMLPRTRQHHAGALTTVAIGATFLVSTLVFGAIVSGSAVRGPLLGIDRLSGTMLVLVTGISTLVHAFATRYMDSDPRYARFFFWLSVVTAAVVAVVLANSLVVLAVGWIGVSICLYQLQTHACDRPAAMVAARFMRTSFIVGDAGIVCACIVLGLANGSMRLDTIIGRAAQLPSGLVLLAVAFLTIAAFSKSSQFPLHRWLPETMEAPTPVSALMHAGIVNAGGFLLARFSPLVAHAPSAALVIFIVGAATALWGTSCMMVRSDVKRGLAYSTVGQMGYMTLQCGLGAFAAAILHLFAHGIFKATLFLGSGYAVHDHKRGLRAPAHLASSTRVAPFVAVFAIVVPVLVALLVVRSSLGRALPPYGWVVLAFAALTCAQAAFTIVKRGTLAEFAIATVLVAVMLPAYALLVSAFDRFIGVDVAATAMLVPNSLAIVAIGAFALTLILGWGVLRVPTSLRDRVYVWLLSEGLPVSVSAR